MASDLRCLYQVQNGVHEVGEAASSRLQQLHGVQAGGSGVAGGGQVSNRSMAQVYGGQADCIVRSMADRLIA